MKLFKINFTYFYLVVLVSVLINDAFAQKEMNRCGTNERREKLMEDTEFALKYSALKAKVVKNMQNRKMNTLCTNPLIVPVVIHFESTTISNACMINASLEQINQLNTDFSGCNMNAGLLCDWMNAGCLNFGGTAGVDAMPDDGACIQFCLADQNLPNDENLIPGGFAITTGYNTNLQNASPLWFGYLNVYVGNLGEDLGFVFFLSGGANTNTTQGASVATLSFGSQSFNGCEGVGTDPYVGDGATLTHEIGHWFGLDHTFEFAFADTPPQSEPNYGCPVVYTSICTSSVGNDYSGNFMDYVDDDCMFTFTQNQVDIMLATVADQNDWATNSMSCTPAYPPCGEANQAGACIKVCPTTVITPINLLEQACGEITLTTFPNALNNGLVVDEDNDLKLTWSINNYLSAGGVVVSVPTMQNSTNCSIASQTYYLNIDCASSPLSTTLNGGTFIVRAYPGIPIDITTLIEISGENSCNEPLVTPIPGCESYVSVNANSGNPTFPVTSGNSGTTSYNVTFTPNPAGPACCADAANSIIIDASTNDGDLEILGNGGNSPWTSTSSNFGSVICSLNSCGTGGGSINYGVAPNSGNWLAWFGGVNYLEVGILRGNFTFPACSSGQTILTFAFENSSCGSTSDYIELKVDGNLEWIHNANPSNCDARGTIQTISVDLSAYADGNSHMILFRSVVGNNSSGSNFTIDNIELASTGCNTSTVCNFSIIADYDCNANCVSNLNFSNRHNFPATYQAAIGIQSTATVNANVNYKAGNRITLNSGFNTNVPDRFTAYIEGCD